MRSRTAGIRAGLIIASALVGLRASALEAYVAAGDTGKILLSVENLPESEFAVERTRIELERNLDPRFQVGSSKLGPLNINPRNTADFAINYTIRADAAEGTFPVVVAPKSDTEGLVPGFDSAIVTINFMVDSTPPALSFINADGTPLLGENGLPVISGDTIDAMAVTIRADDTGGSGIESITIVGPSPFDPAAYEGAATADKTFASLEDGTYTATVTDRAGNVSRISFTIVADRYPPLLTIRKTDAAGEILGDAGDTDIRTLHINATDIVLDSRPRQTGISRISIIGLDPHNDFENYIDYAGEADVSFSTTLPLGDYWIIATDREGNVAEKTFGIISATGPIASLQFLEEYLYNEFRGISVSTPSVVSGYSTFGSDPITGEPAFSGSIFYHARAPLVGTEYPAPISQVRITGAGFNYQSDFAPPRANVESTGISGLRAGIYQATIKDMLDGVTFMPFKVVELAGYLCPDAVSVFVDSATFNISNHVCLKSSLGLKSVRQQAYLGPTGTDVPITGKTLHYSLPMTARAFSDTTLIIHDDRTVVINDVESNSDGVLVRAGVANLHIGNMVAGPGAATITSRPLDLKAQGILPGARFVTGVAALYGGQIVNVGFESKVVHDVPIADAAIVTVGALEVRVDGNLIVSGNITMSSHAVNGITVPTFPPGSSQAVSQNPVLSASVSPTFPSTVFARACTEIDESNPGMCRTGTISFASQLTEISGTIVGVRASVEHDIASFGNVNAGGPTRLSFGSGVELGLPDHGFGQFLLTVASRTPPLRYKSLPIGTAYRFTGLVSLSSAATVTLPYSTTGLTPAQLSQLTIVQATKLNPGPEDFLPIPSQIANGKVTGTTSNLSSKDGVEFMVVAPIHEHAHVVENADLLFQSNRSDIRLVAEDISEFSLKKVLAILGAKGFVPVTPVYHLGPDGAEFAESGIIEMKFTDEQLARFGVAKSTLRILQFNGSGTVLRMPAQTLGDGRIAAKVPFLTSDFAVFGEGAPVYVDLSPPQTTASYTGTTGTGAGGTILLDPGALVRLSAVDPEVPNFSTSGVSQIRFLLDQVFIDTAATPGALYVSSFTLSTGAHSLAYYSVDHAGNVEPVIRASLFVASPDTSAPQTSIFFSRAVSTDAAGRTVLDSLTHIGLAAVDPVIADAATSGVARTRVLFDSVFIDTAATSGEVYSSTFTLSTGAHSLAYYSVDNAGNVEPLNRASLFVTAPPADTLPPQTAVSFSQAVSSDTAGRTVLDVLTEIGLSAVDPATTGFPASGVAQTRFLIDQIFIGTAATPGAVYASTFTLSTGAHSLVYYSRDNAGNVESARSLSLMVGPAFGDSMPPRTALLIGPPASSSGALTYVSTSSLLGFALADDKIELNDGLGAGATQTFYAMDGGPYARFASSFSLSVEGRRSLSFFSIDRAGNVEAPRERSLGVDSTPPSSALSSNGALYSISAADALSGVAAVFYWVDVNPGACGGVVPDTGAARGTCANPTYAGPFELISGPHTVYFQAIDAVGNREFLHADGVTVPGPDTASFGGLGIGRDAFDAFWSVVSENDAVAFARADSLGATLSSAPLPDAAFDLPWSVFFDAAGRAYAIGLAEGPSTLGTDVAVYKASPAGDAIEARILFDSGYANNDLVLDAKAPGWLVGAAQTSGPVNLDLDGERSFALALWKFDPALGAVSLSTTSARGAFDVGSGVAVDPDGSLWIAGYSQRPDAPAVRGFDLALWHYAANGRTVLGGPFLWPGYLSDFDGTATARVHVSGGSVYIAAPRVDLSTGTDMAFLRFDKATSRTMSESVWRAGDGSASYPAAILPEAAGLIVAGGIGAGESQAALWRFGHDGALRGATLADAGGAQGAVLRGVELWLSVDGSTFPYKVLAETPAAGALIDISTPTLASIAVTPASASILAGTTAQFAAAGTFSDGSTRNLTGEVFWSTDASSVATVSAAGSVTGVGGGTARVIASSGAIAGQTTLTVTVPAPTITAISPTLGDNAGPLAVSVSGSGIVAGARLELHRNAAGGSGFTASGVLGTRIQATAVRLANGKVLIAGGQGSASNIIFSSAEIFDPNSGSWSATGAMAAPRFGHTMTLLPDGKVLVAGGMSCSNCNALNTTELYDPATGTWSYTGSLAAVRFSHSATSLASGKVLVAGGGSVNNGDLMKSSAELYDPVTRVWTSAGVMPSGAHFLHPAATLPDGRVLVAGGRNTSARITSAVDIYDPGSNAWSAGVPMSKTRVEHTLTALLNGKLLAMGGDDSPTLATTEIYDPETRTWTAGPPQSSKRDYHTSTRLTDGTILVVGGFRAGNFVPAAEIFDPVAGSWSTVGTLPRLRHTATLLADGSVLVAGGFDPDGLSAATSIYRPASVSIVASNVRYSDGNAISGVLDLTGQPVGLWDVVVTNPNQLSARLSNAFTIQGMTPTLAAITVTPAAASILAGTATQFAAAGTFSDGSMRPLTSEVAWSTDASSVATITASGLATGVSGGTARVIASSGAVTGRAELTVTVPALTVSSIAPSSAASGTSAAATITGTGFDASAALSLERSDVLRGTWTATGSFAQGRMLGTLTKLRDGRALLAGGMLEGSAVGLSAVDLYDPATGSWTAGPPLRQGRNQYASVLLADGRLLVAGGNGPSGTITNTVEIYDPALNTWTMAAPMALLRTGHQLALLSNGRVLAAGGWSGTSVLRSAEIYDPVANAWSPAAAMSEERYAPAMATLSGGKALIAGGSGSATAEVYDFGTNAWTPAGTMSVARQGLRSVVLPDGKVLVSGGTGPAGTSNAADVYNPATNGWTATGPMGVLRNAHTMVLANGTPLIIGGENSSVALGSTEIYDASANVWRPGPGLMGTRTQLHAAVLDDGRVLVAGGRRGLGGGTNLNSAELLGAPSASIMATGVTVADAQHLSGAFNLTGAPTGIWDVVVRETSGRIGRFAGGFQVLPGPPALASISVTPASASILAGTTAQFAAAGTYSDGSTRTLTGEVIWSTDVSSVATVAASGLATGVGGGRARVIAASGTIAGQAVLTVTPPTLAVKSISPASATAATNISAAVTGTGFDASAALSLERSDVLRGTWTATGSFAQARMLGTLTKLRDGRVLLAGGMLEGSAVGLSAVDLYDPATGSWTAGPPLRQGRNQYASVLLADGRLLVAGGNGPSGTITNTVEIYDPALNTWTMAAPMALLRTGHQLALLSNGRVLAAGGWNGTSVLRSAEIYDPVANAWSPATAMNEERHAPAMATLSGGKALIAGGSGSATAEVYDFGANAWTPAGTMSVARQGLRSVVLPDGRVLVSGGTGPAGTSNAADVYNPATNGWTATGAMGVLRNAHTMVLANGAPLIIGGENSSTALGSTEIYDAATNAWRPGPGLMGTRTQLHAAVLDDGRVLVAGGRRGLGGGTNLNSAEVLGAASASIAAAGVMVTDAQHLSGTLSLIGAATGYWDVVVRESGGRVGRLAGGFQVLPAAPTLASIAVTPASASILAGATAQFAAAGTFSDGSTRILTGEVTWSTDVSSVATVSAAGLATGVGGGRARVIAASRAILGQAGLSVSYVATSTVAVGGKPELTLVSTAPFSVVIASSEAGAGAVALGSAAAQGLTLVGTVYDVTRQDAGATATLTWSFDPALVDASTLAIWRFDGISWSSITVLNQLVSVTDGVGTVTGEVGLTSLFGLFTRDVVAPVTTLIVDGLGSGATTHLIASASTIGFAAVDAGAGVRETRYGLDGGPETVFVSPFNLTEGRHALTYRSVDRADNLEGTKSASIAVDATAPRTSLIASGGRQYPGVDAASFYASSDTRIVLSAEDPLVNDVASGLASTEFSENGGAIRAYVANLALTEGVNSLNYRSRDNVGNLELLKSATVFMDATPPVSAVAVGAPSFTAADGTVHVAAATPVAFTAADPALPSGQAGAGVERLEVSVDGGVFVPATGPLTFAEGRHTVRYRAVDNVGNAETARTFSLRSDATPPLTTFTPSGALFTAGERSYAPAHFTYALPAQDPVAGNVASGVAVTRYRTGQGAYQNFASAFSLSEGVRLVEFQSQDNVGNLELLRGATVFVDATAPVSALAIGGPRFDPGSGLPVFVAAATPLTLSAQDPEIQEVASGVRQISFHQGSAPFEAYSASFTLPLPDGLKTIDYFAADNVGNVESARGAAVALDNTAPATALAVLGGRQFPGPSATSFYASSDTRLILAAVDPMVNGVASGLALTRWQDNGGAFQAFTAAFALPEGVHALGYQSQDRVQNAEAALSSTVLIDATPPVTTAQIGAPLFVAMDGTNFITPATPVAFTAADPTVQGVASGVGRIEAAVDGGPFTAYSSALTFAEGRHVILYRAIDNVANVETVRTLNVQSDATAPESSLAIGAPKFDPGAGQPVIVAAATFMTLTAQDPAVLNVAAGARDISFRRGEAAFGTYAAPFALQSPDGLKTLAYFATDNVGNQEAARSTTIALDGTPPLTTLAVLGGRQFPGPDAASFYASSDTRLALPAADPVVGGVASGLALTQWQDNSGASQAFALAFGLSEGRHLIAYQSRDRVQNMEVLRSTTVLVDAAAPISSATIGSPLFVAADGTNYVTPATPVTLSAVDPALPTGQPGSGASRIEVAIDGGSFSAYSSALTFGEGRHTIVYRAIDNVANVETLHTLHVRSDATPPVSSLVVGQPQFQLPTGLLVSTRTPFSITPADPIVSSVASGVKDTSYRVSDLAPSGVAYQTFSLPFKMAGLDVNKVIEFYSRDNVLNTEAAKSSTVLLDSTPPEVALLSPASCGAGICRVLKGRFSVLGTAQDRHFQSYALEFAPGKDASAGFALISSGTVAVSSGSLGTWDATALSGWLTLRLSAADLVANTASVTLNVFVGDPAQSLVLGNHEVFDMPEGVAVGGDGKIYVADRNNDRIAIFSSTGSLLAAIGGRKDDDEDDDHNKSTTTVRLNKPSGVAVDAAGNVYVADTNRDRVLKFSAAGQVLLSLGKFHHPAGVAVDAASNIYVADTDNRRVQVFSSTGAFSFQFNMPPVPTRLQDDDDSDDDDDEGSVQLGKPSGIAVDAAGNIYVADPKGGRALKYGAAGELLLTIPIPGDKPGKQGEPYGVAISSSGDCLLVSDRKTSRILKFDFLGNSNLVFGGKGKIKDDEAPVRRTAIIFKKPMGLALDSQGNLFVTDRNNNRIQMLGLPTGQAPLVVPPPKPGDEHIARDVVDREDGGKVERGDRAAVDIPAGAVALDLKITVSTPAFSAADDSNRRRAAEDAKLKTASPPVEYGPEGTKFKGEVTLTLPYSPDLVALQKIDAKDLIVRYWNREKTKWEDLESVVDPKTRTVKAKTTHFSLYQVFSGTVSAAAISPLVADAAFTFHDAYAFPNPARGVNTATIRMQTGLADSVEVRVYDVSGRKIHSSSNFSLNPDLDDGNGKGQQYTYDHVWDVSGVGSGVYLYVITAKKTGHSDIHKTGRVGVVK